MRFLILLVFFYLDVLGDIEKLPHISAEIGAEAMNRIQVDSGVYKAIGNSSEYKIISEPHSKNVFLVPKISSGILNLSLITVGGNVIDLFLDVKNIAPQVIKIHEGESFNDKKVEAEVMLKCMMQSTECCSIENCRSKYWITKEKHNIKSLQKGIKLTSREIYRWKNLVGFCLFAKNITSKPIEIKDLRILDKALVWTVDSDVIPPKADIKIFVVFVNV